MKNILFHISILLVFAACGKQESYRNPKTNFSDYTHLLYEKRHGGYSIRLDSLTSPANLLCLQVTNNLELFGLNRHDHSIYQFDLVKGKGEKFIQFITEGPNGTGEGFQTTYVHSKDSILVNNAKEHRIHLFNSKNNKKAIFDLNPLSNREKREFINNYVSFPAHLYSNRPVIHQGKLYLTGVLEESWGVGTQKAGLLITYDMLTGNKKYDFTYPEVYGDRIWGMNYRTPYRAYNNRKKTFVYSLPADHYVYEINFDGETINKAYAGSSLIDKINFWPYSKKDRDVRDRRNEFYFSNHSYEKIVYDQFRNVYYRFARHPYPNFAINSSPLIKKSSIIILDSELKPIGEYAFDKTEDYYTYLYFVTEKGLHIAQKSQNEDVLTFSTFKLTEK